MADHETLLVVEDNIELRDGLWEILSLAGYRVLTASNGSEALRQMEILSPDLILSDITMPEMDGYEFYRQVRERPDGIAIPFIFLTARGDRQDVIKGKNLGVEDYLIKPVSRSDLLMAIQTKLTRFRQLQLVQLQQAYHSSLILLANAVEQRDQYTRGHIERVTDYSLAIAEILGWKGKRLEELRFGAILHDIGKLLVDPRIWMKAGPLSEEERREVKLHTVKGAEMIREIPYLHFSIDAIMHHHERWDGAGYPAGLAGDAIPMEARIIAVTDSLDAMTTTRPYHAAASMEVAHEEIIRSAGTIYDPTIVAAFRQAWEQGTIQKIAQKWRISDAAPTG